jgi:hypothetical protein
MELLKPIKPYLEKHYQVASDRADLYCYFYELGVNLLKADGRLGYISSSTFFKTGSGEPLRRFLLEQTQLCDVVDFGDLQVFEGVTTYPAIVVLEKTAHASGELHYLNLKAMPAESLATAYRQQAQTMPQSRLDAGSWQLESDARGSLRDKLTQGHPALKEIYGSPLYGIKTGFNEAFVVDRATRDALVAADPRSAELLKPFLEGKDLKKWRIEPQDLWLIYTPKNRLDIDDYPAIKAHLLPFREKLEQRATKQAWFELQQAQEAYAPKMALPKIIYGHFSPSPLFSHDAGGSFSNDKSYIIPSGDFFLLGLLNSNPLWYLTSLMCPSVRGGYFEVRVQYIETLPIPAASESQRREIATLAEACQRVAEAGRDAQAAFRRRIADLAPGGNAKLNGKLNNWWELDFAAFRAEVKKLFKQDIPLAERNDWETFFNRQREQVATYAAQVAQHEAALNRAVYALFKLTPEEIALVESGADT